MSYEAPLTRYRPMTFGDRVADLSWSVVGRIAGWLAVLVLSTFVVSDPDARRRLADIFSDEPRWGFDAPYDRWRSDAPYEAPRWRSDGPPYWRGDTGDGYGSYRNRHRVLRHRCARPSSYRLRACRSDYWAPPR
jgi:hypothetical protein